MLSRKVHFFYGAGIPLQMVSAYVEMSGKQYFVRRIGLVVMLKWQQEILGVCVGVKRSYVFFVQYITEPAIYRYRKIYSKRCFECRRISTIEGALSDHCFLYVVSLSQLANLLRPIYY